MKRMLAILLIICSLLALLVPAASAADSLTDLQRAVVETALAYYYKGGTAQYDSYALSAGGRYSTNIPRLSLGYAPEEASKDDVYFTVCSSYPEDVYYNAFGIHLLDEEVWREKSSDGSYRDDIMKGLGLTEEQLAYELAMNSATETLQSMGEAYATRGVNPGGMVVGHWTPSTDEDIVADEFISTVKETLQPGDVINLRRGSVSGTGEAEDENGHALLFLGDIFGDDVDYIIHSTGSKYSSSTGKDDLEASDDKEENVTRNGTIHIGTYDYLFNGGVAKYYLPDQISVTILRPLNRVIAEGLDMTSNAQFRLHHPAIALWKTASVKPGNDVMVDDTITYTIKIENATHDTTNEYTVGEGDPGWYGIGATKGHGAVVKDSRDKPYSDLVLTETIPAGTKFVSSTVTPTVSGSTLTWNVPSISAGSTQTISYTVQVTGGTQVVSPKGTLSASGAAGFLGTKELKNEVVQQQFPADKAAAVTADSVAASTEAKRSGIDAANDLYAALGYELNIPGGQELMDSILVETGIAPGSAATEAKLMLADADKLTGEARTLRDMVVPGLVGGKRLFTVDENGVRTSNGRLRTLDQENLQPGDVLIYIDTSTVSSVRGASEEAYVYLGDDNFAYYSDGVFTVVNDPIVLMNSSGTVKGYDIAAVYDTVDYSGTSLYSTSEIFHQALRKDLVLVLRPARVGLVGQTATSTPRAVELVSGGNSTYYASLADAYNAAAAGDTIVLQEDVTTSLQKIKKSITIDLNGHSVTGTNAENDTFRVLEADDGTETVATIKNGTVNGVVYVGGGATVTLKNIVLCAPGSPYTISNVTRNGSALCRASSGKITLKNVSIASKNQTVSPIQGTLENITVEDDLKVLIPVGVEWDYSALDLGTGVQVYTPTATRALQPTVKYTEGTDAYTAVTFTTTPDVYNETKRVPYAALTDALRAKDDGDVLRLQRDVDASDFDEVAMTFYSSDGSARYFVSSSKFTLDFNGFSVYENIATHAAFIIGAGPTTLKNGTIYSRRDGVNASATILLENMVVAANRNAVYMSASGTSNLTVDGSTLLGGFGSRREAATQAIDARRGTAVVKGGSKLYSVSSEAVYCHTEDDYYGTVTVEDATLGAAFYSYNASTPVVVGSAGGVFSTGDGFGKTAVRQTETLEVGGRTYTFVCDEYESTAEVVTIGDKTYPSVSKALEDAQAGDTLTLNATANETESVVIPEDVTLDLANLALTLADGVTMTVSGTVTGGSVNADASQLILQGNGSFLGITIPEGVTGTVHPDVTLNAAYNMAADSTVEITGTVTTGHTAVQMLDLDTKETKNVENGKFFVTSCSAKQMGESNRVVLMATDGDETYVGQTVELCVQSTAEQILKSIDWDDAASAKAGRALVAMLNYGAQAQTYFEYKVGALANANISAYQSRLDFNLDEHRTDESRLSGSGKEMLYGTSCVLGEELQMKMYFRVPAGTENVTVDLSYGNVSRTDLAVSAMTAAEDTDAENNYYSYVLEDLTLTDLDTKVNVTVKQDGTPVATATETLRSYLARFYAMEDKNAPMADAILSYALAVNELG